MTDDDMLAMASVFDVSNDPQTKKFVRVELRPHPGGGQSWVVINEAKFLLSHEQKWEYEPLLSGDFDFTARTRWDDPRTAIQAALQEITTHGKDLPGRYPDPPGHS
jgi:hypothetical protein